MKIAKVILEGDDGQQVVLDTLPFMLDCAVGRCLMHGSDAGVFGLCPQCHKCVCRDHWNEQEALCEDCAYTAKRGT